jgi:hypothetical protein
VSSENKFCHNCGAPLVPGAAFCARCGTSLTATTATPPSPPPSAPQPEYPYRRHRHEKQEKQEKYEKNEKGEKGGRGTGIIGPLTGGLILIWLGITFYLQQANVVPFNQNWWAYFISGIGAILILQGILLFAMHRRPFYGPLIGGAFLILIGVPFIGNYNWGNVWPLFIIVIGVAILASAFARRRTPTP